jgi:DNA-binding NtrC family response regulator
MNPATVVGEQVESNSTRKSVTSIRLGDKKPVVLIATIDPEIRTALSELLDGAEIGAIWVNGVKEFKTVLARERVVACLCGFWLQDGTYREVIRHLRRERLEIPTIIVSAPACPQEFRDYLAAMNLGTLDFLSYPYRQADLTQMLESALEAQSKLKSELETDMAGMMAVRGAA